MYTTRLSLMQRVRDRGDHIAWQEFYDLYGPLIYRYGRQRGLSRDDAEDIVSACLEKLTESIGDFEYQPERGKFKSWLRRLVYNTITDHFRKKRPRAISDSHADQLTATDGEALWERAWQNEVMNLAVRRAEKQVSARNFQIFKLNVLDDWPAERIAEVFNMTTDQVYRAKYKVLQIVKDISRQYIDD